MPEQEYYKVIRVLEYRFESKTELERYINSRGVKGVRALARPGELAAYIEETCITPIIVVSTAEEILVQEGPPEY